MIATPGVTMPRVDHVGRALLLALFFVSALVAGCKGHGTNAGRACSASVACPVDYTCVYAHDGSTVCMQGCTINETVCMDGSACLPLNPGPTHACYLGGDIAIGDPCSSALDCVRTGICVGTVASATCFLGCNLDGTVTCPGGATCMPTADGNNGFCPP
jgi:hypothetical protein